MGAAVDVGTSEARFLMGPGKASHQAEPMAAARLPVPLPIASM
jgi:hypothetical protein